MKSRSNHPEKVISHEDTNQHGEGPMKGEA